MSLRGGRPQGHSSGSVEGRGLTPLQTQPSWDFPGYTVCLSLIPGQGTKIPHAMWGDQKKKKNPKAALWSAKNTQHQRPSHAQSYLTLCHPMDCSLPGSSVYGILQVRILEWAAIFLLQGIFPTQGSNLCLCISCIYRGIFYHCTTREVLLMGLTLEI